MAHKPRKIEEICWFEFRKECFRELPILLSSCHLWGESMFAQEGCTALVHEVKLTELSVNNHKSACLAYAGVHLILTAIPEVWHISI